MLFPYLFKRKRPKNLSGFQDFVEKISDMGLDHLIVEASAPVRKKELSSGAGSNSISSANFWYIG